MSMCGYRISRPNSISTEGGTRQLCAHSKNRQHAVPAATALPSNTAFNPFHPDCKKAIYFFYTHFQVCFSFLKAWALLCKLHILFYTKNTQSRSSMYEKYIAKLLKTINLGAKNGPVGWNGLKNVSHNLQKHRSSFEGIKSNHVGIRTISFAVLLYFSPFMTIYFSENTHLVDPFTDD